MITTRQSLVQFVSEFHKTDPLPVLFTSHGNPMDIPNETSLFRVLNTLGIKILEEHRVNAVLIISAHWNTKGTFVDISENPRTIYDFYGFPETHYKLDYKAPGSPLLANEIVERLPIVTPSDDWGLDHGSWPILRHLFPNKNIPIVQLSMDYYKEPAYHYELAQQLKYLRNHGVLIIGSGSLVHNLKLAIPRMMQNNNELYGWENVFEDWVMDSVRNGNHKAVIDYKNYELGLLAAPTPDHYVPLLYALGVVEKNEPITDLHEGMFPGFSDKSFLIGKLTLN